MYRYPFLSIVIPKMYLKRIPSTFSAGFYQKHGLLYRLWIPLTWTRRTCMIIEQLELPVKCRKEVLQLAHSILLSGHLCKDKKDGWYSQAFLRQTREEPTLYGDVAEYCQTREEPTLY